MFNPSIRDKISSIANMEKNPFVALNTAYLNEGVYIHISSNVDIKKPLAIVYETICSDRNDMFNLRNLIDVEKNSSVQLIETFCYDGKVKSSYFMNVVNEIYMEENSHLRHYKIQDEAFKAAHIAYNAVKVDADASYKSFCLQKGADMARNESYIELSEEDEEELNIELMYHDADEEELRRMGCFGDDEED
jgi:Fe-S cluster assembly protein SufD